MRELSDEGRRIADDLARRYGFSLDAVTHMMLAVLGGNSTMAQFSHPEFGGSGQWMRGGMTMLGNMFDHALKGRVDSLCSEIASILASQPGLLLGGSFQSQSQGGGQYGQSQTNGGYAGESQLFVPDPRNHWWPRELGQPTSTGAQNNMRYAYFPNARRLAVDTGGDVWLYDTLDHRIGGFSQQQGTGSSILFSSQYGTVNLSSLPVVSRGGQPVAGGPTAAPPSASSSQSSPQAGSRPSSARDETSILDAIARLGELRDKGTLSDEEFTAKKRELLNRL